MARVYREGDIGNEITAHRVAILGYGSQGHAHALNLKESGCDVRVGLYEGSKSWPKAEDDGLSVATIAAATGNVAFTCVNDTASSKQQMPRQNDFTGSETRAWSG